MYNLKVIAHFSSAHNLKGYRGKCEDLHGHNWKVELEVSKDKLDKIGMLVDFHYLKKKLHKVLEALDHKYLNNIPYFKKKNPTSENIAGYIYDRLRHAGLAAKSVTVWENETSSARYEE